MLALASDHGGFELKNEVKKYLDEKGIPYKDFGCHTAESCDYPDMAKLACDAVAAGECDKALLFCGTGIGISMAANKIKGIRAAACSDYFSAKYTRATTMPTPSAWEAGWSARGWQSSWWTFSSTRPLKAAAIKNGSIRSWP